MGRQQPAPSTFGLGVPHQAPPPASPASAIDGVLAGRAPPTPLGWPLAAFLAQKPDISPQVQRSVIDHLTTAMSPEEGTLPMQACEEGIWRAAQQVRRRGSDRLAAIRKRRDAEREAANKKAEDALRRVNAAAAEERRLEAAQRAREAAAAERGRRALAARSEAIEAFKMAAGRKRRAWRARIASRLATPMHLVFVHRSEEVLVPYQGGK